MGDTFPHLFLWERWTGTSGGTCIFQGAHTSRLVSGNLFRAWKQRIQLSQHAPSQLVGVGGFTTTSTLCRVQEQAVAAGMALQCAAEPVPLEPPQQRMPLWVAGAKSAQHRERRFAPPTDKEKVLPTKSQAGPPKPAQARLKMYLTKQAVPELVYQTTARAESPHRLQNALLHQGQHPAWQDSAGIQEGEFHPGLALAPRWQQGDKQTLVEVCTRMLPPLCLSCCSGGIVLLNN
eukprot:1717470-Amphidinium_carterae.1